MNTLIFVEQSVSRKLSKVQCISYNRKGFLVGRNEGGDKSMAGEKGKSTGNRVKDPLDRNEISIGLKDRALAAAAEGITIADIRKPDQPLIYANEGFERLTLYPVTDIVGRNCRFLQGPDTDPAAVEKIRNAIEARRECTLELLNYRKDGKTFWNRLSLTPIRDQSGETTHYIGVQSDVTSRRIAEEALRDANRELERANLDMKRSLEAAARIQRSLLPRELPKEDRFEFAWLYEPSEELAGDTLNAFRLDDRHIALYIIDVSGHGVPAALLSVTLSHWLAPGTGRSALVKPSDDPLSEPRVASPSEVAEELNRQFPMDLETAQYFTLLYGVLDTRTAELCYVSAGSPPIIQSRRMQQPRFETVPGFPIGIAAEPHYQERKIQFEPGDRIYLFTDGLPDAMNSAGDDFGMDRLVNSIDDSRGLPLEEALSAIMDRIRDWAGEESARDDATMLGIENLD
jgi:PAS domain S-box-containing protein